MVRAASLLFIAILATFLSAGCSSKPRIIVGSKNFTEQVILGEILAQHLERRVSIEIERRLNLGGTLLAHEALKSGGIDLYPEYTGTALTAVLKQTPSKDAGAVLAKVRDGYRQWSLTWLDPLGFNNTFAMVIRSDAARRLNLNTLSEAARRAEPWLMGVGYEFTQRPDGLKGLLEAYSLRLRGDPVTMDLGLLYPALATGKVDMAAANSTDGNLARGEFTVLADDRQYFPPYQCAVIARNDLLDTYPHLRHALEELSGRISEVEMRRLNAEVDGDKRPVGEVARDFLNRGGQ